MKNYVILTLSLVLGVSTVFAHTPEEQKIDAIKHIYQEAQNKKLDVLDQKYATPAFAQAITRQMRYADRFDWQNNDPDNCVELMPKLIEGNGYIMEDIHTSMFYSNRKGQVVAELDFGNSDHSRMAFSLVCQGGSCKVDDMIDSYGYSTKDSILQYCPR